MVPQNPAASRLGDLLEAIKGEFDQVSQEAGIFKMRQDELEHKSML